MTESPSVLVTGSSGVVGTALVQRLLEDGTDVRGIDRHPNPWSDAVQDVTSEVDLLASDARERLPADVDTVVHLAAHSRVRDSVTNPLEATENMEMLSTVLEYARETESDFLFTSSREVYGYQGQTIYHESDAGLRDVKNPYGASKAGGEALVEAYRECYGIRSCTLRLSNVYGRFDSYNRVIPLFIAQAARGQDLTVYGDNKLLDFLYIDDCVDALVWSIDRMSSVHGEVVNVGSGEGYSLLQLAELVVEAFDADIDVTVDSNRPGEVDRYVADLQRSRQLLGFKPDWSLEDGLDETVEWYTERPALLEEIL
ncbi:NAD-dependent epimerase/dehydratase family protein [Haloarchaeobius litoreus]|uniref:NAD-dependent epimerase/dehydratase family protein n=1 Tax=Haloarchaeobius litoreus TaxID=755306 RepID=A0ABD6DLA7_9EURY|nr:NAD-dependent epimerase/dehydratase family protein [Haloarchaeobius litoreus]